MATINAAPYRFQPAGLSDALTEDFAFPGACSALVNLIPDPSNKNLWQARPAAVQLAALTSVAGGRFASTAFISCMIIVGNLLIGMATSNVNSGKDEPFCYNLTTNSFVTITGVTSANSPASVSGVYGDWTPPSLAAVGIYVVIAHPGYDGITNFFGAINISNPAAPVYSAGNCATNPLPSAAVAVAQFFERAYFLVTPTGVQPALYATDVNNPLNRLNAAYILTFGDDISPTALASLSLQSPITGGVVSALVVFKDDEGAFQITGDFASSSSPIAKQALNLATGTQSPLAIANVPQGILILTPDGIRLVNQQGNVGNPIGEEGQGITLPFRNILHPSRAAAAATASVYRVTLQNGAALNTPIQEYWYDLVQQRWSGPHTFPASIIVPFKNTFIMTPQGITGTIWQSDAQQSSVSTFTENGNPMNWTFQTVLFGDPGTMSKLSINESTVKMTTFPGMTGAQCSILNSDGSTYATANGTLAQCSLQPGGTSFFWGVNNWGTHPWLGTSSALKIQRMNWPGPVAIDMAALQITGASGPGFNIGDIFVRPEVLGYLQGM